MATSIWRVAVSESAVDTVREYIENKRHITRNEHSRMNVELLRRHGVEFDEKYLWD